MKGRKRVVVVGGADCPLLGSKCTPDAFRHRAYA
jgi:hypothetical protein